MLRDGRSEVPVRGMVVPGCGGALTEGKLVDDGNRSDRRGGGQQSPAREVFSHS